MWIMWVFFACFVWLYMVWIQESVSNTDKKGTTFTNMLWYFWRDAVWRCLLACIFCSSRYLRWSKMPESQEWGISCQIKAPDDKYYDLHMWQLSPTANFINTCHTRVTHALFSLSKWNNTFFIWFFTRTQQNDDNH